MTTIQDMQAQVTAAQQSAASAEKHYFTTGADEDLTNMQRARAVAERATFLLSEAQREADEAAALAAHLEREKKRAWLDTETENLTVAKFFETQFAEAAEAMARLDKAYENMETREREFIDRARRRDAVLAEVSGREIEPTRAPDDYDLRSAVLRAACALRPGRATYIGSSESGPKGLAFFTQR